MCIRDSFNKEAYALQPLPKRGEMAARKFACAIGLVNNDTCLLYTSDAADERSSVDLGGRRIIKQKKLY